MHVPKSLAGAGLIALLFASPAFAQAAGQPGDGAEDQTFGEIVITAQKIEQRQSDVPITVSVLTGERLEELGVSDLDELSAYVPGLNIQEQSANNPGFVIRGITSDSGSAQESARVTLYYNGIDISRSRGSYQDLYDLERIEVVKGPQATLFGTAAAIGALSVISARPRPGFSGQLTGGAGNFDQRLLSGFVNVGSDVLAGRLAFAYKNRRGYIRNIAGDQDVPNQNSAGTDQRDLNGQDQFGARGSLRWNPSEALRADLIVTYDRQRNPGTAFKSGSLPPTGGSTSPFTFAELSGSAFSEEVLGLPRLGLRRDLWDVNFTLSYDLAPEISFTTVNGFRDFDALEVFDADGSPAFYLEFAEDAEGRQFSHESRFTFDSTTFRGFFGFNIFRESGRQRVPFSTEVGTYLQCTLRLIPNLPCVAPSGTVGAAAATGLLTGGAATFIPYSSEFQNRGRNKSYSVFADGTWIPTPALEVTAGVRALIEDRTSFYSSRQPVAPIANAPLLPVANTAGREFSRSRAFSAFLPRFNLLYRLTEQVNAYATISRGRRSPVVQLSAANSPSGVVAVATDVAAEKVWNYEAGLKGSASILSGQIAVFYQTYDNFQVSVVEGGRTVTRNAGSATNWGIEAEVQARFGRLLTAFANVGYIDAAIDDDPENGIFAGQRFRLQPEWQAAAGFTLDVPVSGSVSLFATPTVTHRSRIFFELPNNPLISQDATTLVNLRAGLRFDDRLELTAYARNLFDEDYLIDAGNTGASFGYPTFIAGEPRLYGVQATVRF